MNIETVGGMGHRSARARLGLWPYEDDVAQLVLLDHNMRPDLTDVRGWVADADDGRHRMVRTGALFPQAAAVFETAGFHHIDELALFDAAIDQLDHPDRTARAVTSRMRTSQVGAVAALDRAAFGDPWGNDERSLADISAATPRHRARVIRRRRNRLGRPADTDTHTDTRINPAADAKIDAFAISGQSGPYGYLQRLAVHERARRCGLAHELVRDAVTWMQRRGATRVMVNTAVNNVAAIRLYESLGFRRLPESLFIMERALS